MLNFLKRTLNLSKDIKLQKEIDKQVKKDIEAYQKMQIDFLGEKLNLAYSKGWNPLELNHTDVHNKIKIWLRHDFAQLSNENPYEYAINRVPIEIKELIENGNIEQIFQYAIGSIPYKDSAYGEGVNQWKLWTKTMCNTPRNGKTAEEATDKFNEDFKRMNLLIEEIKAKREGLL